DVLFTDPQRPTIQKNAFQENEPIDEDGAMTAAIHKLNRVVLGASFELPTPQAAEHSSKITDAAVAELERDPWQTSDEVAQHLSSQGISDKDLPLRIGMNYPDLIREATHRIVHKRIKQQNISQGELWKQFTA